MELMYGEPPLATPDAAEEEVELAGVQDWDRLNALALGKFKFYLHEDIWNLDSSGVLQSIIWTVPAGRYEIQERARGSTTDMHEKEQ